MDSGYLEVGNPCLKLNSKCESVSDIQGTCKFLVGCDRGWKVAHMRSGHCTHGGGRRRRLKIEDRRQHASNHKREVPPTGQNVQYAYTSE